MKLFSRFLLFLLFIPIFILFLFSTTLKYQLLNENFWIKSLSREDTYSNIIKVVIPELQKPRNDFDPNLAKFLLTEGNLREFSEKNIHFILAYINGGESELKLFIPFSKLPKGFLPLRFKPSAEELTITELNSFMGGRLPLKEIEKIPQLGFYSAIAWIVLTTITLGIIYLMYKITESGKRLTLPGISFILTSLPVFAFAILLTIFVQNPPPDVTITTEPAPKLIWIIAPPLFQGIMQLWMYISLGLLTLGIGAFFIKKPGV